MEKQVKISPIGWKAHKQKRKVASTLAAEAIATSEGLGALDWFRAFWEWLVVPTFRLEHWKSSIAKRPALILTDCKSVYDSLQQLWSSSAHSDKRTSIDLAIIRDTLSRDESKIRWIDTKVQLADTMTKRSAPAGYLRSVLREGMYQVVAERHALDRRSTQRKERGSCGV